MGELYRPGLPGNPTRAMLDYIQRAHARLRARTMQSGPLDLGTSLTVAWVLEGRVHWVQVGGTRLYLFRNDKLVRLTPIHTQHEFEMRDGITSVGPDTGLVQAFIWGSEGLGDVRGALRGLARRPRVEGGGLLQLGHRARRVEVHLGARPGAEVVLARVGQRPRLGAALRHPT